MLKKFLILPTTIALFSFLTSEVDPTESRGDLPLDITSTYLEEVDWLGESWADLELNTNSVLTYMNPVVSLFLAGFSLTSRISYNYQSSFFLEQHERRDIRFMDHIFDFLQQYFPAGNHSSSDSSVLPAFSIEGLLSPSITMEESLLLLEGTALCCSLKNSSFLDPAPFCSSVKFLSHLEPGVGQRGLFKSLKEGPVLSYLHKDLRSVWVPLYMRRAILDNLFLLAEDGAQEEGDSESSMVERLEQEAGRALEEEWGLEDRNEGAETEKGLPEEIYELEELEEYRAPCLVYKVSKIKGKWYFWFVAKKYFREINMSRYSRFAAEVLFDKKEPMGEEFMEEDLLEEGEFGIGQEFFVAKF